MNHRERVLSSVMHKPVDRIPLDYWGTQEVTDMLMKELGACSLKELWNKLDIDKIVAVGPAYIGPEYKHNDNVIEDYWRVKSKPVSYEKGIYYETCGHPIEAYETIDEIKANYTFPKADWFDYKSIPHQCDYWNGYTIECGYNAPFYMYSNIRGYEQCLMDFVLYPEIAHYVIGEICSFLYEYQQRIFETGAGRIDFVQVTDDFGSQSGLLVSPAIFDEFFEPHYTKLIKLVKDNKAFVFHHDDGAIFDLLPKLAGIGIDVLNPIQWHLPGMDLTRLKSMYGQEMCFHGGIDNQYVLPFGSKSEIEEEVGICIQELAKDGTGYILAPCHNIQSITPVENIIHMYKTAVSLNKMR